MIEKLGMTPGPWVVDSETGTLPNGELGYHVIVEDTQSWDPIVSTWGRPHSANARLIAAAPNMFEALIFQVEQDAKSGMEAFNCVIDAIEKATGKTWAEIKELIDE